MLRIDVNANHHFCYKTKNSLEFSWNVHLVMQINVQNVLFWATVNYFLCFFSSFQCDAYNDPEVSMLKCFAFVDQRYFSFVNRFYFEINIMLDTFEYLLPFFNGVSHKKFFWWQSTHVRTIKYFQSIFISIFFSTAEKSTKKVWNLFFLNHKNNFFFKFYRNAIKIPFKILFNRV